MQKHYLAIGCQLLLGFACNFNRADQNGTISDSVVTSTWVSRDSANKMINSYSQSLDTNASVPDLYSVTFDASQLRAYLSDTTIKGMKVSLAHKLSYINAGHKGQPAGYRADALTLVISAFNASGNFVFHNNQVLDFGAQCPTVCPEGTAGSILFPLSTTERD